MAITINDEGILIAVKQIIDVRANEFITEAVSEYERKLREEVGRITISLFKQYSISRSGDELLIRVKHE